MLVLTRKTDEAVRIPGISTSVRVVETRPGTVRLGFEGPANVRVYREGLLYNASEEGQFLKNSAIWVLSLLEERIRNGATIEQILDHIQELRNDPEENELVAR